MVTRRWRWSGFAPAGTRRTGRLSLDVDNSTRLTEELVFDEVVRFCGDLDEPAGAVRLHAAGCIDGVTPQVVGELFWPMMPATTGPELIPMRKRSWWPMKRFCEMWSRMSRAS